MRAKGYSIWLIPTGEVYYKLAKVISQLSKKYSAPNFEPHLTLIGDLLGPEEEIISKTSELAGLLKPFKIELKTIDYFDEYFKCLFVRAKKSKDLIRANDAARKIFNKKSDKDYMPHLSLMYGDFIPETKEKIIAGLKDSDIVFNIKSLRLFCTTGTVEEWKEVKKFAIQ